MPTAAEYNKTFEELNKFLDSSRKSAHSLGSEMQQVSQAVVSFGSMLKTAATVEIFQRGWKYLTEQHQTQRQIIEDVREQHRHEELLLQSLKYKQILLEKSQKYTEEEMHLLTEQIQQQKEVVRGMERYLDLREKITVLATNAAKEAGLALTVLMLIEKATKAMVDDWYTLNKYFQNASTSFATRYDLMQKTLSVQRQLGASTEKMGEANKALIGYGLHLRPNYEENLKTAVMMEGALGVSVDSTAELTALFQNQLKQSTAEVADSIANI